LLLVNRHIIFILRCQECSLREKQYLPAC